MTNQHSDTAPDASKNPRSALPPWFLSALPFIITAFVSVILTLLIQALWLDQTASVTGSAPTPPTPTATIRATSTATPLATSLPTVTSVAAITTTATSPTSAALVSASAQQELVELRQEMSRLWSAYYLARASSQIADAEAALRVNNLHEVGQVLATVGATLDQAYEHSAEQEKGPISEFRIQVGRMHADLHVRPDGMDQQLRRLRQSMLSLVDERS